MFDKGTESEWLHVTGEAVMGPMKGNQLPMLPTHLMTWAAWKKQHPDTTVMAGQGKSGRMETFAGQDSTTATELGLTVTIRGRSKLYPYTVLMAGRVVNDRFQNTSLLLAYSPAVFSALAWNRCIDGKELTFEVLEGPEHYRIKDAQTGSVWDPLNGKCLEGRLNGKELHPLIAIPIYNKRFSTFYPQGVVYEGAESGTG